MWPKNECSVMAALICIKRVRETFCRLVNIANRFFTHFFQSRDIDYIYISGGVQGTPIFQLDYIFILSCPDHYMCGENIPIY